MLSADGKRLGIYIHIPFCKSKCAYCDFYSFVPKNETIFEEYTDALIKHFARYKNAIGDRTVDSVFIGGGTPTVLPEKYLFRILFAVKKYFRPVKNAEISMEVNPATADKGKLWRLRVIGGVNRLSIGMQSASDAELSALSRIHSRDEFEQCYRDARKAGFDNINVDVMFGIPCQTPRSLLNTLSYLANLSPEHISMYNLKIEPNTAFGKRADTLILPDEDTEYEMYMSAIDYLEKSGYNQYEISNFAKRGKTCRHNLKYWNCDEYLGFGPAAHSYFNKNRFSFVRNIGKYIEGVKNPQSRVPITEGLEEISGRAGMGEYVMLRMRLREGVPLGEFYRRFGVDFFQMYGERASYYVKHGFMTATRDSVALTPRGMFVSNYILSDLLSFEDLGQIANVIS